MKRTDVAMIILIASVSVLVSYFVVSAIPVFQNANEPVKVKTIDAISENVGDPDADIFNADAINPTVQVTIGGPSTSSE